MERFKKAFSFKNDIRVGWFLAKRDIKRANIWTTTLIVFVMIFTFLNLVVVSGILVGLIEGSVQANKEHNTGDIFISSFLNKDYIDNSENVVNIVQNTPGLDAYTARVTKGGRVTAEFRKTLLKDELQNAVGAGLVGIDPEMEDNVTGLSDLLVSGTYLSKEDPNGILVGKDLLYNEETPIEFPGFTALKRVKIGDTVLVKVGDSEKEYIVRGILKGKVNEVDSRVFMNQNELRKLVGSNLLTYNEIAIKLKPNFSQSLAKEALVFAKVDMDGRVQTSEEAQPKFLQDIKKTFAILGNAISSIGLVVASITIFIVIFVNAITRRRYIGILKGIGISRRSILLSYVYQSVFYAGLGSIIGMILVFAFIKPAFIAHPIDFPFSDGILVATLPDTLKRVAILLITTIIAGFIPARIVVKQNTLSAILGR
jgi:ABC-type lipoprotein release transport system permease subunit